MWTTSGIRSAAIAASAAAVLAGCVTTPEIPVQLVAVDTGRVTGAACVLEVPGARSLVPATPAVAAVPLTRGDLRVTCSKEGFVEAVRVYPNLLRTELVTPVVERSLVRANPIDPTPLVGYPEAVSLFLVPAAEAGPGPAVPAATPAAAPATSPRPAVEVVAPRPIPTAPPAVIPTTRNPVGG
jgi:hypothetical protein